MIVIELIEAPLQSRVYGLAEYGVLRPLVYLLLLAVDPQGLSLWVLVGFYSSETVADH